MGIPIEEKTTYRAVIAPVYPDGSPIVSRGSDRDRLNSAAAYYAFGREFRTDDPIVRLMLGSIEVVSWLAENLPATRIDPSPGTENELFLVATFADETDATAFKTRWG